MLQEFLLTGGGVEGAEPVGLVRWDDQEVIEFCCSPEALELFSLVVWACFPVLRSLEDGGE